MKSDMNFSNLKKKAVDLLARFFKHLTFAVILFILFIYIFTVWRISQLASADPTPDQEGNVNVSEMPKVDQRAINQVLQLENNSPQIHSLFNQARNNPFGE